MQATSRIRQLPQNVVNQIAAGEIIERTASVVKELVENSIDAGASRIEVEIQQGGQDLIRVTDNGHGIYPEDLPLAMASHATSKLHSAEDLALVDTLGFRGEALASIGSVAKVVIQSCPHDLIQGGQIASDGERVSAPAPWNGSPGTRVEVRHLFFNSPVRRKFLKSPAADTAQISEILYRLILSRAHGTHASSDLHWVYRNNEKVVFQIPGGTGLVEKAALLFGKDFADELLPVEETVSGYRLTGFIGSPNLDQGSSRSQYFFLNGRWFRDKSVAHALQEGFKGHLMTGRFPVAFLFLDMAPEKVDVNVHPAKSEVRFREAGMVHHLVHNAVKKSLALLNPASRYSFPDKSPPAEGQLPASFPGPFSTPGTNQERQPFSLQSGPGPQNELPLPRLPFRQESTSTALPSWQSAISNLGQSQGAEVGSAESAISPIQQSWDSPLKAIQFFDSYILLETAEGVLVIDQHALHERVLYEQLKSRLQEGKVQKQNLLIPETIELPASVMSQVIENLDSFAELGFEIRGTGAKALLLDGIPAILGNKSPGDLFLAIVDHLYSKGAMPSRETLLHQVMSLTACHSAVRAGDKLTGTEMAMLAQMRHLSRSNYHCPHGRPTSLLIPKTDLERQFGRT